MSMNTQIDLSKLCGRKLSDEEVARIREVASNLELRDDDAIWQLLAAMEYQRIYYEKLPDKIGAVTADIIKSIGEAAEKETQNAQAKLAQSVVEEARGMAKTIQWGSILPSLITAVIASIFFAALTMWAGYQLGSREIKPMLEILHMPIGLCLGLFLVVLSFLYLWIVLKLMEDNNKSYYMKIIFCFLILLSGIFLFLCSGGDIILQRI